MSARGMVSLPSGFKAPSYNIIGSQEFDLLPHSSEVKSPTSEMESTPLVIQHEIGTRTWITNGAIRCIIPDSDLHPDEDNDNEDMTLLSDDLFVKVINTEMHSLLVAALMKDNLVKSAVEALKTGGIPPIKSALTD
jgi:hypothetical protein